MYKMKTIYKQIAFGARVHIHRENYEQKENHEHTRWLWGQEYRYRSKAMIVT